MPPCGFLDVQARCQTKAESAFRWPASTTATAASRGGPSSILGTHLFKFKLLI
jgi:hypothetical protein